MLAVPTAPENEKREWAFEKQAIVLRTVVKRHGLRHRKPTKRRVAVGNRYPWQAKVDLMFVC